MVESNQITYFSQVRKHTLECMNFIHTDFEQTFMDLSKMNYIFSFQILNQFSSVKEKENKKILIKNGIVWFIQLFYFYRDVPILFLARV